MGHSVRRYARRPRLDVSGRAFKANFAADQRQSPRIMSNLLSQGTHIMRISILVASVLAASVSPALAHDTALPNVTVYGTATTEVTPDLMNWHLTVTNKGKDLAPVADNHSGIVASVLKLLNTRTSGPASPKAITSASTTSVTIIPSGSPTRTKPGSRR